MLERLKALMEKLRQRLFSKTYWASMALVAVGSAQHYANFLTPFLPADKMGAVIAVLGLLMAGLREVTSKPLSEK